MSDPKHRVELSSGLYLSITDPKQYWAFPFVIAGHDGTVRVSLRQEDAIKVMRALIKIYPLDALGAIE